MKFVDNYFYSNNKNHRHIESIREELIKYCVDKIANVYNRPYAVQKEFTEPYRPDDPLYN